ncbi:DEAD/DEAH box helicase [Clostridium sp. YIM B02515]|uniref:DEAD/DEAH box helicase n=1 Tax=Clostridium rhizosphaerae TaxID=2803861 RepID=A0ABS1TAP3_9CLOT|nr:DEAD/DEAH box helicase [Clostridium rhizosphaerae]MBL4936419.1 DEAD/DEAH box helicase [Clostridium rhizosphaerae]
MMLFEELGLSLNLIDGLKKEGITEPTDIQEKVIPLALENKDIIGQSQTGSGKTLAYLLPIFQRIQADKREMQAIILAPTHELVMQIDSVIKSLSENSGAAVTSAAIIGDVNIKRQVEKLREKPHIIVGSTGRIFELIKMKKISAHTIKTIVIDEGDRLLDDKNIAVVKDIIKTTLRDRQLMIFSATIDEKVLNTAKDLMKIPEVIKVEEKLQVNPNISHMYIACEQRDKMEILRKLIAAEKPKKAIVFINKGIETEITTSKLQYHHIKAYGIYGSAEKEERKKAMEDFRNGKLQILVASDIAARGIDVKDVTHIINLDLPVEAKDYLHRVGRTGRADQKGKAVSIVTDKETTAVRKYEKSFGIEIKEKVLFNGKLVDK